MVLKASSILRRRRGVYGDITDMRVVSLPSRGIRGGVVASRACRPDGMTLFVVTGGIRRRG